MFDTIRRWLGRKWAEPTPRIAEDFRAMFMTPSGQRALEHLISNVYCTTYEGSDPILMAHHNGMRTAVHDMLRMVDMAENPERYKLVVKEEERSAEQPPWAREESGTWITPTGDR